MKIGQMKQASDEFNMHECMGRVTPFNLRCLLDGSYPENKGDVTFDAMQAR